MTCHEARDLYSALLDEALAARERAAVEAHVMGCAECRRELDRLRRTVALVRRAEPVRAPAGFVDRVVAAADPAPWYRRLARYLFSPLGVKLPLAAAAVLMLAGTAVYIYQHTSELPEAARQEAPPPPSTSAPTPYAARPTPPPAVSVPPGVGPARPPASAEPSPPPAVAPGPPASPVPPSASVSPAPAAPPRPAPKAGASAPPTSPGRLPDGVAKRAAPRASGSSADPPAADKTGQRGFATDSKDPRHRTPDTRAKEAERQPSAPAAASPPAPSAGPRDTAAPQSTADVSGRLAVADAGVAQQGLADLLERAGGHEVARRPDGDAAAVDVVIPREGFADFVQGLSRLGRLSLDREPGALPALVRMALRIVR